MASKLNRVSFDVLRARYLKKNIKGRILENPKQMFKRVVRNIAQADLKYNKKANIKKTEQEFYEIMSNFDFLPNSPTLMNAGNELQQLASCFVLPVEDSMESIFTTLKNSAIIHQSGGGTGFNFSKLRPKGDIVKSTHGVASGPISFIEIYDKATDIIKQGGTRRGANMAILNIDHPDIEDFVTCKSREILNNFNISVAITDDFMKKVEKNQNYNLINPRTRKKTKKLKARKIFNLIVENAWKHGDPGIIFIDRMNRDNPIPSIGKIESTNPCGEQPLLSYEACNLGSINLSNMIKDGRIDYKKLEKTIFTAVHFLDNVIDMCKYPLKEIEEMVHANRKIGLGVMGFADMLIKLGIPYNSEEAIKKAEEVMKFIQEKAREKSILLAQERGVFKNYEKSIYSGKIKLRNATLTTIAPTGTISLITGCSSGIEPLFAIAYKRIIMDKETIIINSLFEEFAKKEKFYTKELMRKIAEKGTLQDINVPEKIKEIFITSHEITPEYHIKIQAAFQKYVDNAVSKTVNFSENTTIKDVENAFLLDYRLGCKGITIYRDKSKEKQIINIGKCVVCD